MTGIGFFQNIANVLGIPLGTTRRKDPKNPLNKQVSETPFYEDSRLKDDINTIIDITKDDICIGEVPLFYKTRKTRIGKTLRGQVETLTDSLNRIVQGAAVGILKRGYAVYTYKVFHDSETPQNNEIHFYPVKESISIYRDERNRYRIFNEDGEELENTISFIYEEEEFLEEIDSDDPKERNKGKYWVNPLGLQVKNAQQATEDLANTEASIQRLRSQMRYIRFATVEVGLNLGGDQQAVVDDISEGLNADSQDLPNAGAFEDNIPVFPVRRNAGKPEVHEYAPTTSIGDLTDLDHNLSKWFMSLRFPKTYADFSSNLSQTAVSLIRGDIRYNKLLTRGRSIIETTINRWISDIDTLREIGLKFYLTTIPSPEEDDVTSSLQTFTDFTNDVTSYVLDADSKEESYSRLEALDSLYSNATNLKSVESWRLKMKKVISSHYEMEDYLEDNSQDPDLPTFTPPGRTSTNPPNEDLEDEEPETPDVAEDLSESDEED